MNLRADRVLRWIAAYLQQHDVPRVGWPASVVPPPGVHVEAVERASVVTIVVTEGRRHAAARLDLDTREVAVSTTGRDEQTRSKLRRIALHFVADRNAFDRRAGIETRSAPPSFDPGDPDTWTEMQLLADVTDSDWYPPEPVDRGSDGWAAFYATAHRFNDRFTQPDAAATVQHPAPPRGGR
ncbi:hypothetical protein [Curtobacterium sp. VKM Ac-2922]|uniref:hypothetical protein n=1 Tax=Curtobacterium sp. VKM Ac-2922 TaxID=2929475 RepID=UPI001FB333B8|nr:hypothetical protein [Curtobacterium sp. VKM Ac-2922]MCJ1715087.1 hypothetical protein [Curtobacterium sp. VKM Ac-2922]